MGQAEIIIDMVQRQLLAYTVLTLAQRIDSTAYRGHALTDVPVESVTVDRRIAPPTAASERRV